MRKINLYLGTNIRTIIESYRNNYRSTSDLLSQTGQICPEVEPEPAGDTVSAVLDTSLTPAALKKLSRSVMDLSGPSLSDVTDISKSTARGPVQ